MYQFFSYYGAKMRAGRHYPDPRHSCIVEPFAGSAGYSTRHHTHKVWLRDTYKPIVEAWQFLIRASHDDIMDLPLLGPGESLASKGLDDGSRALIGFWLHRAGATPRDRMSSWAGRWASRFWGPEIRGKIARQVGCIKHWECDLGSYRDAPDIEATWYVDPPYVKGGHYYPHGSKGLNYTALADWCHTRRGQVIVCEQGDADWLPFLPLYTHKGIQREERTELVWTR